MTAAFDSTVTLTIELAFGDGALEASPTWTDVSSYARAVRIRRGRSSVVGRFEAGTAEVTFDNRTGRFSPQNTAGAYYPDVKVGVPIRIKATEGAGQAGATGLTEKANSAAVTLQGDAELVPDSTEYVLFRGIVEEWPVTFPDKGKNSVVTVPCVDGFKLLAQNDIGGQSYSAESTDTRIGNVLDDVGWPAGLRDLDSGVGDVQAFAPESQPALTHILDVAEAEVGAFFVNSGGTAVFQNRVHYSGGASSGGTFTPSGLPFADVALSYDDEYLWNDVRITRDGGEEQTYTDATSITAYGRRVLSRTGQPNESDPQALNVAQWLGQLYAEPRLRIDSLVLYPRSNTSLWPQVLGRELRDAVTVTFDPPSGDQISQVSAIQSIEHTFDAQKNWVTTWQIAPLSDLEQEVFWILETSDDLDTDTILA